MSKKKNRKERQENLDSLQDVEQNVKVSRSSGKSNINSSK
jgi:hypothetical protein